MTTTVANIIDELKRDYLFKPHEQPVVVPLLTTIDDSETGIVYKPNFMSAIEEDSLGNGALIEIGSELMRVSNIDSTTRALVVQRGVLGTTAILHTSGDIITVKPELTRKAIFEAVADSVVNLGPRLYPIITAAYPSADSYIEVDAGVDDIIHYRYKTSEAVTSVTTYLEGAVELLKNFTPSSTTVAIQTQNIPSGRTGYLTYKGKFTRPSDETYDLDTNLIKPEWFLLIRMGALIRIMAIQDLSARNNEFISDALQVQGFPVGSGESVDLALARIYQYLIREAEAWLTKDTPMMVLMNRPG